MANFTIEARIFDEATQSLGPAVTLELIKKDGQFNPDLPDSLLVYQNAQWVYYQKRQADAEKKDPAAWVRARKYENSEDLSWDQVIINPKADNKYLYYFRGLVPDQLKALSLQTPNILRQMNERKIACQGQLNREKEDIERKEKERIRALPVFPKKPDFPVKETAIPTDKIYLIKAYVEEGFDDIPDMPEAFTDAEWWASTWALEQQELMAQILSPTKGQITLVNTNMPYGANELLTIKQARYREMLEKMTPEEIDAYFGVVFQNEGDNKPTIGDIYYQIQKILHDKVYELRDQTGIDYTQRIDLSNLSPLMPSASGAVKVGEYVQKRKELINTELNDQAVVLLSNAFVEYTQNRTGDSIPIDDTLTMGQAIYLSHLLSNAERKTENDDMVIRTVEAVTWATQSISREEFMDQLVREGNEHANWSDLQFNDMFNSTIDQRLRQFSTDISDFEKKYYSILKVGRLVTWYDDFCKFMGFEPDLSLMEWSYRTVREVFELENWKEVFDKKTKEEYLKEIDFRLLNAIIVLIPMSERNKVFVVDGRAVLNLAYVLTSPDKLLEIAITYPSVVLRSALLHEGAFEKFKELFLPLLAQRHHVSHCIPLFKVLFELQSYKDYIVDRIVVDAHAAYEDKNAYRQIDLTYSLFMKVFTRLPHDKMVDFLMDDKISSLINEHMSFSFLLNIRKSMTDDEFNRYLSSPGVKLSDFVKNAGDFAKIYNAYSEENRLAFLERGDAQGLWISMMTEDVVRSLLNINVPGGKVIDASMDLPIYFDHYLSLIAASQNPLFYERFVNIPSQLSSDHIIKLLNSEGVLKRFRDEFKNGYLDAVFSYKNALTELDYAKFCEAEGVYDIINSKEVDNAKSVLNMASYLPKGLRYQYITQGEKIKGLCTNFDIDDMDKLHKLLDAESYAKVMKAQWMVDLASNLILNSDSTKDPDFSANCINEPPFKIDPDNDSESYQKSVHLFYDKCITCLCEIDAKFFILLLSSHFYTQKITPFYENFISYAKVRDKIKKISTTVIELRDLFGVLTEDLYKETLLCDNSTGLIADRIKVMTYNVFNPYEYHDGENLDKSVLEIFKSIPIQADLISLLIKLSENESLPSDKFFWFLRSLDHDMGGKLPNPDIYNALNKDYIKKALVQAEPSTVAFIIRMIPAENRKDYLDHLLTIDIHQSRLKDADEFKVLIDRLRTTLTKDQRDYFIEKWVRMLGLNDAIPLLSRLKTGNYLSASECFDFLMSKGFALASKSDPTLILFAPELEAITPDDKEKEMKSFARDMVLAFVKKGDIKQVQSDRGREALRSKFLIDKSKLVTSYFADFTINVQEHSFCIQVSNFLSLLDNIETKSLFKTDEFIDCLLKHDGLNGNGLASSVFSTLFDKIPAPLHEMICLKLLEKAGNISRIDTLHSILCIKKLNDDQKWHILAKSPALKAELQEDLTFILLSLSKPKNSGTPEDRLVVLNAIKESLAPSEPKETQYSWKYKSGQEGEEKLSNEDLYQALKDYFTDDELGKIGLRPSNTPSNGVL